MTPVAVGLLLLAALYAVSWIYLSVGNGPRVTQSWNDAPTSSAATAQHKVEVAMDWNEFVSQATHLLGVDSASVWVSHDQTSLGANYRFSAGLNELPWFWEPAGAIWLKKSESDGTVEIRSQADRTWITTILGGRYNVLPMLLSQMAAGEIRMTRK